MDVLVPVEAGAHHQRVPDRDLPPFWHLKVGVLREGVEGGIERLNGAEWAAIPTSAEITLW
jgi:hypothetical protein